MDSFMDRGFIDLLRTSSTEYPQYSLSPKRVVRPVKYSIHPPLLLCFLLPFLQTLSKSSDSVCTFNLHLLPLVRPFYLSNSPTVRSFVCGLLSIPFFLYILISRTYPFLANPPVHNLTTMVRFVTSLLALSALSATALASTTTTCSTSSQCPKDKPCCSGESFPVSYRDANPPATVSVANRMISCNSVWRMRYWRILPRWL